MRPTSTAMVPGEEGLAAYAMKTNASQGRRHPEVEHPYRPAYVRDRDRIIHSAAFRRLAFKTQVFASQPNDHHRTRLTHTLEVVQIARTVARHLKLNEDLTEAAALAHDLGHPPYGHAGERVLAALMKEHGGFEHNRQGLRLVQELESRYPEFPGLNLTYEVLESIALHSKAKDAPDVVEFQPERRMLAEFQVVDLADSIAYSTHDIDDALRHGIIAFDDLEAVELWREAQEKARAKHGKPLSGKQLARAVIRFLIDTQVGSMIAESERRLAKVRSVEEVRSGEENVIELPAAIAMRKAELQAFLFQRVYRHENVTQRTRLGEEKVRRLFETMLENPALVPEKYRIRSQDSLPRQICDYIASMTDRYADRLHAEVTG